MTSEPHLLCEQLLLQGYLLGPMHASVHDPVEDCRFALLSCNKRTDNQTCMHNTAGVKTLAGSETGSSLS